MNRYFFLIIILIISNSLFSQKEIDVNSLLKNAEIFLDDSCNYKKSISIAKKALEISSKKKDYLRMTEANQIIGFSFAELMIENDSTFKYLSKALTLARKYKFKDKIAKAELGIELNKLFDGSINELNGKVFRIIDYFNHSKNKKWILKSNITLSLLYFVQHKTKRAIQQEKKVLRLAKKYHFKIFEFYSKLRLAHFYVEAKNFKSANTLNFEIKKNFSNLLSGVGLLNYYAGLTRFYEGKNDIQKSVYFNKLAIQEAKKINFEIEVFDLQITLGFSYLKLKRIKDALKLCDEIQFSTAKFKNKRLEMIKNYFFCAVNYEAKNYKKAFDFQEISYHYYDSVHNESNSRKIEEIRTLYETSKKIQKIKSLKKEKELTNYKFYFVVLISIIIGVILIFIAYYFINKLKKEKTKISFQKEMIELEAQKKIKALEIQILYAQMNPHFVFNCLSAIQQLFLSGDRFAANAHLNNFSRLLRLSIDHVKNDFVSLEKELEFLKYYIQLEQLQFENPFDYKIDTNCFHELDEIQIPSMILQPHLENAIHHGIKNKREKCLLQLSVIESEDLITISITDNGVGRTKAREIKSKTKLQHVSRGLALVEEKIMAINDLYNHKVITEVIDLYDDKNIASGTKIKITFQKIIVE